MSMKSTASIKYLMCLLFQCSAEELPTCLVFGVCREGNKRERQGFTQHHFGFPDLWQLLQRKDDLSKYIEPCFPSYKDYPQLSVWCTENVDRCHWGSWLWNLPPHGYHLRPLQDSTGTKVLKAGKLNPSAIYSIAGTFSRNDDGTRRKAEKNS